MKKNELLSLIFKHVSHRAVLIPLDDSSISGPESGLRHMGQALQDAVDGGADAILGFYGLFKRYSDIIKSTPGILNLTLSTEGDHHLRKVLVSTVEQAKRLNVGVSVHLNTSAPSEPEMLSNLGRVAAACDELDVVLLAHVYPRRVHSGREDHYDELKKFEPAKYAALVRHGARIASDLGADIIKVPYTGDAESFSTVVESTYGQPVLMAGGPKIAVPEILGNAYAAIEAGAAGVAVGRNFFQREKSREMVAALRQVVHQRTTARTAMAQAGLSADD